MSKEFQLPVKCPACQSSMHVKQMHCVECGTVVNGDYPLPQLMYLEGEDQQFVLDFLKASGSLKKMASLMGRSYPSVRNRLDEVIQNIENLEKRNHGS